MDSFIWTPSNSTDLWVGQEDESIHVSINMTQRIEEIQSTSEDPLVPSTITTVHWPIPTSIRWSSNIEFPPQVLFTEIAQSAQSRSLKIDGIDLIGIGPFNVLYLQDDFSTYTNYNSWSKLPATNGEIISYRASGVSVHHVNLSVTCVGMNENLIYYGNNHKQGIPGPAGMITEETKVYRIVVYSNFTTGAHALKAAVQARHKP